MCPIQYSKSFATNVLAGIIKNSADKTIITFNNTTLLVLIFYIVNDYKNETLLVRKKPAKTNKILDINNNYKIRNKNIIVKNIITILLYNNKYFLG